MSFELRPYQNDIIAETRAAMLRGVRSICIESPTGSGKTALTAAMLKTAASKGMSSLFLMHRRELVNQSIRTFASVGVPHGVIASGWFDDTRPLVQLASVQTYVNRLQKYRQPSLLIYDEAHHIAAGSWAKIHAAFPKAFHIGLTATPERLDGHGLGKWFSLMIKGPSVRWLIDNKYLSPYRLIVPPGSGVDVEGMHKRGGDYVTSEVVAKVDKPTITGDAVKHYLKFAAGKRGIISCASIEHSKHVVGQFKAAGISAAHVDGETPSDERDRAIKDFELGRISLLSNVDLFSEGFDVPAAEVAILLRPTASIVLSRQRIGRVLRYLPGKTAIIIDHVSDYLQHGLPCDEKEWSLAGRSAEKSSGKDGPGVKVCPKCFAAQRVGGTACSYCGFVFVVEARAVEVVDGELVELNLEAARLKKRQDQREQGTAKTMDELIKIGRARGFKRPELWAAHVYRAQAQQDEMRRLRL